jgi:hypothetical protein
MRNLKQPILTRSPETGHDPKNALKLKDFLSLLKKEEDYWKPDQNNTKLMITRLRKIFYDQWGWNSELIREAAHIESRYKTEIRPTTTDFSKPVPRYKELIYTPVHRVVTYTKNDRVFGNSKAGEVPLIYQKDHQDVLLPEGFYCDTAHILAGLDAINNKQVVGPLPNFLSFLEKLFPHVSSNTDVVTWLGDIASTSADFLFTYLRNKKNNASNDDKQIIIDDDSSGSDMLGDIEPYVIAKHYNVGTSNGKRFTEIMEDYYFGNNTYRDNRFLTFCKTIGLKGWDGESFENEKQWMKYYRKELKNSVCFVAFSQNEKTLAGIILPIKIWFNCYKDVLQFDFLLGIFLDALKQEIKKN